MDLHAFSQASNRLRGWVKVRNMDKKKDKEKKGEIVKGLCGIYHYPIKIDCHP